MRGSSDIPSLRLEVLQGLITTWYSPDLKLQSIFPTINAESDTIRWESRVGGRGLTPFVPSGSPAPRVAPVGLAEHSAKAAFFKEKMFFDEEALNNLREPGTYATYRTAQSQLAENMVMMENRLKRRKEWMFAMLLTAGQIQYYEKGGMKINLSYGIPSDHVVTLTDDAKWSNGSNRNILSDITDGFRKISDANGAIPDVALCNSATLRYFGDDPAIRTLLQKQAYGDGTLIHADAAGLLAGTNASVIGKLMNIQNLIVYDEKYVIKAYLTGAVTADSTVQLSIEDATDFETDTVLKIHDQSEGTSEELTVSSINRQTGVITIDTAPTSSYKARVDFITMTRSFIPDNQFLLMATRVDGMPICTFMAAPFGLDRHYGMKVDKKDAWDPEGTWIRVQNKGLPVLKQKDALYILTVA